MLRCRCLRLTTTFVMVLSLLFAQLALASYVCPGQSDVQAMVTMAEAGIPCEGMDQAQPVLCHQYAADPAKTFKAVKSPVVAPAAVVQALVLPWLPEAEATRAVPSSANWGTQPPPGPLFLATLRLRF